jgi:hypothetical protein
VGQKACIVSSVSSGDWGFTVWKTWHASQTWKRAGDCCQYFRPSAEMRSYLNAELQSSDFLSPFQNQHSTIWWVIGSLTFVEHTWNVPRRRKIILESNHSPHPHPPLLLQILQVRTLQAWQSQPLELQHFCT